MPAATVALTQPGQFITTDNGVKIIGFNNWPGRIAGASSALFARNLLTFLTTFWDKEAKAPKLPAETNREGRHADPRRRRRAPEPRARQGRLTVRPDAVRWLEGRQARS